MIEFGKEEQELGFSITVFQHRINEKSGVEFLETAVQTLSQDAMQLYDVRLVSDLRSVDVVVVVVINVKVEALECV